MKQVFVCNLNVLSFFQLKIAQKMVVNLVQLEVVETCHRIQTSTQLQLKEMAVRRRRRIFRRFVVVQFKILVWKLIHFNNSFF